jgi:hypothetical protein
MTCQMPSRRFRIRRALMLSCLGPVLLTAPCRRVGAQSAGTATPTAWEGWVFGRAGAGSRMPWLSASEGGGQALLALTAGAAASHGMMFGMLRGAYNERFSLN